ncbi:MAG: hypothetical protein A4E56_01877 [Pelotomaculum sp. PtaU1.Bin065]|nr:MAG: hypothetical protein A4E56_01877 [Pelotomaculum sp. PtaU1.Bin065]
MKSLRKKFCRNRKRVEGMSKYCFRLSFFHFICRFFPGLPPKAYFLDGLAQNGVLLDCGCGDCSKLKQCHTLRPDLQLYGCDILSGLDPMPGVVHFYVVNIEIDDLPWPQDFFDGIILNHVLEHLANADHAIKEILRVLKKGGRLYLSTPSKRSLKYPSFKKWLNTNGGPINFFDDPTHIKAYSRKELEALLQKTGFASIKTGVVGNVVGMLAAPFLILFGFLLRKRRWASAGIHQLTGWSIYATAVKDH